MAETLVEAAARYQREQDRRLAAEQKMPEVGASDTMQTGAVISMQADVPTRDIVLGNVREASQLLTRANSAAIARNPMSADVPAFKELVTIAQRLNMLMQELAKVRGL